MSDRDPRVEGLLEEAGAEWRREDGPSAEFTARLKDAVRAELAGESVAKVVSVPRRASLRWLAAAAVLAVAVLTSYTIYSFTRREKVELLYAMGAVELAGAVTFSDGDEISTGADGRVVLRSDGGRVTLLLSRDSRLRITGEDRIALLVGDLWASIEPNSGFYQVSTPHSTVTVKGTQFGLSVTGAGTEVFIEEGEVSIEAGRSVTALLPGRTARVGSGDSNPLIGEGELPDWVSALQKEFLEQAARQRYPSGWSGETP